MAVASEQPPWEMRSAIPGAQVHTSLCDVKPTPPTIFIFSDDSNFRAPTDRRITFSCLPLPCLPWGNVTRASLTVRPAGPPRFSHLGTDLRAHEQSSDDHHPQRPRGEKPQQVASLTPHLLNMEVTLHHIPAGVVTSLVRINWSLLVVAIAFHRSE